MGKTLFLNDENIDYLLSCALEGTRNRFDLLVSVVLGEDATMKGLTEVKHLAGVTKDAMESLKVHMVVAYAAESYLEQSKRKYASHEDIKLVSGWLDQARDLYREALHLYEEMWQVDNDALALFIIEKVRSMNRQAATISNLQLDLLGLKMMAPYKQLLEEEIIYSTNVLDDKIGSMKTKAGINKLDGDLDDIEDLTFTLRMFKKEYDAIGSAIEAGNRHVRSILIDPNKHKCKTCHAREAPQPLTHILVKVLRDKADRTFGLSMEMRNHVADCLEFKSAMWHAYGVIDTIERRRAMERRRADEDLLAYGYGLDFMRYMDGAKARGEQIDPWQSESFRSLSRLAGKSRNGSDTEPRTHSIEDKFLSDPMLITSKGIGLPLSIFKGLDGGRSDDGECHCDECRSPKEGMGDLIDRVFKSHGIHHIDDDQLRQFIKTGRFDEIIREAFSKSG